MVAGSLDFATAVDLVRFRGRSMQEAVPVGTGAIAAVLGLDDAAIEAACREAAQGEVVEPVNYNSPGQIAIAGHATAVARAIEAAKARGAKRAVTLPMSVPSHSSLMRSAAERLGERLAGIPIVPRIPYYSAFGARRRGPAGHPRNRVRQAASPVRWTSTVVALLDAQFDTLIECGPGKC